MTVRSASSAKVPAHPSFVVGWREWIALPDLGVPRIKAKIDTGAKSSAIHAFRPQRFERDGAQWVRFAIHPVQEHRHPEILAEAPVVDERTVRSSNGQMETRLVVRTRIGLYGRSWPIELSLTNRDQMGFRMLVGRQALRHRCLVDAAASFVAGDTPLP
ncbi:MAG: ATP-dependent zinc protease [Rhodothalassiaceae bacterium]